jgi:hypothetical protein
LLHFAAAFHGSAGFMVHVVWLYAGRLICWPAVQHHGDTAVEFPTLDDNLLFVWTVVAHVVQIERIISLLSASPVGEARLPMPKGMAYKD